MFPNCAHTYKRDWLQMITSVAWHSFLSLLEATNSKQSLSSNIAINTLVFREIELYLLTWINIQHVIEIDTVSESGGFISVHHAV